MRAIVYIAGPFLWVLAFVVVDYVIRHGHEVGIALILLGAVFLLALALLVPMRVRRVREEAERPLSFD